MAPNSKQPFLNMNTPVLLIQVPGDFVRLEREREREDREREREKEKTAEGRVMTENHCFNNIISDMAQIHTKTYASSRNSYQFPTTTPGTNLLSDWTVGVD